MFKIKDLMIKVISEAPKGDLDSRNIGNCTGHCSHPCNTCTCYSCSNVHGTCGCTYGCTGECTHPCTKDCTHPCTAEETCVNPSADTPTPTPEPGPTPDPDPTPPDRCWVGDLWDLKVQLQKQLAQVEDEIRIQDERAKPQSIEEAEALEKKLLEALDELRKMKTKLGAKKKKKK